MDNNICAFIVACMLMVMSLLLWAKVCDLCTQYDDLRVRIAILETKVDMMDKECRW